MKFKPMLFSTPMVQALLNGTKTETRRIKGLETINENPNVWIYAGIDKENDNAHFMKMIDNSENPLEYYKEVIPYCHVGDIIWVRETFNTNWNNTGFIYKANFENPTKNKQFWKPSLFMPKDACRIFLKCTSVHVERLQNIDEQDAINEGVENLSTKEFKFNLFKNYLSNDKETNYQDFTTNNAVYSYQTLWQKINGKDSWDKNPFVWVYKFEKIEKPIDFNL
jgi:hypothetical protein